MPELPEVETTKCGLAEVMTGKRIAKIKLNRKDLRFPFPSRFAARVRGERVTNLRRRAKYLWIDLGSGETLISHLGMSGRFVIEAPGASREALSHNHVVLELDDGTRISYCDPRRFGLMDLCPTEALDDHPLFSGIGVEPLGNEFNADHLSQALRGKKTPIKSALLDQRVVAGLGNIYVCEALFRAGISPRRQAFTVAGKRAERLAPHIRAVLREAIAAGGSSLKDFAAADGELGYFQTSFAVYGREGLSCLKDGCPGTVSRIVQAGRSTFFCSRCQR